MQLTPEQFHGIISSLRSEALAGRRASPRVGLRLQLSIIECGQPNAAEQVVWLRDLSVTGMGFVHTRPFSRGSHLVARFQQPGGQTISLKVQVIRSKQVGPMSFEIGTKIERMIPREELDAA